MTAISSPPRPVENPPTPRRQTGFTLMELMIVVVVAAILLAIGVPSYRSYVREAQRGEARAAVTDAAARLDRHFFDNNTYTTDLTAVGYAANPVVTTEGLFSVAVAAGSSGNIATSYLVTATSVDSSRDPSCTALTLSSQGQKGFAGSGDIDLCW